jgi:hypothetical protein
MHAGRRPTVQPSSALHGPVVEPRVARLGHQDSDRRRVQFLRCSVYVTVSRVCATAVYRKVFFGGVLGTLVCGPEGLQGGTEVGGPD